MCGSCTDNSDENNLKIAGDDKKYCSCCNTLLLTAYVNRLSLFEVIPFYFKHIFV